MRGQRGAQRLAPGRRHRARGGQLHRRRAAIVRDPVTRPEHSPQAREDQHVIGGDPLAVQGGQVECVVEHAGVHLGRRAGRGREQLPVMSQLPGLALAQTHRRQSGRRPAASDSDHRFEKSGPHRRELRQHQGTELDRRRSTGNAFVSEGGTKMSIAEQSQDRPMESRPTIAEARPAEPGGPGGKVSAEVGLANGRLAYIYSRGAYDAGTSTPSWRACSRGHILLASA